MNLSGEEVVEPLQRIGRRFDAKVHIFHSVKDKDEADKGKIDGTVKLVGRLAYTFSLEEEKATSTKPLKPS